MTQYFTSTPKRIEDAPSVMWGCHVFAHHRPMAICQAYGRSYEEAHDQAHYLIGALEHAEAKLAERALLRNAVATKARHYVVRSPVHKDVAVLCGEDTTLQLAYDHYFDECERAQKNSKSFDEWKAGNRE